MQAEDTLQEICENIGIQENLNSDRGPDFCGQKSSYLNISKGKKINLIKAEP